MTKLTIKTSVSFYAAFFASLLFSFEIWAACPASSTLPTASRCTSSTAHVWNSTLNYDVLRDCVCFRAAEGDTINVAAGNETWPGTLDINKSLQVIGAGSDRSKITSNTSDYLILYNPASISASTPRMRIAHFSFDINNLGGGITLGVRGADGNFRVQTNVRIDHNIFKNQDTSSSEDTQAILIRTTLRGVIDNNRFEGITYPIRSGSYPSPAAAWWNSSLETLNAVHFAKPATSTNTNWQADDNIYLEDNFFDKPNDKNNAQHPISDCQYGGRYVFRYNTFDVSGTNQQQPLFDMHGNEGPSSMYSCFGGEMYGNRLIAGASNIRFLDQRGGQALIFGNATESTYSSSEINVREEHPDSDNPTTNVIPQHVSNSYYWNNWHYERTLGPGGSPVATDLSRVNVSLAASLNGTIQADRDFFRENTSLNGSSGIGCGPLNAAGTEPPMACTHTGVAYWATQQACDTVIFTAVGEHMGVQNPPHLEGALYHCNASNHWVKYYTPLPYPHPLRDESNPAPTSPFPPLRLRVGS